MSIDYRKHLDVRSRRWVQMIGKIAQEQGVIAYLVGGIVRDILLNHKSSDLDIVVDRNGLIIAEKTARALNGKLNVYPEFRTATVQLPEGQVIDFATARKEVYLHPGALPAVYEGDIKDDLLRRDFTMNAMAICFNGSMNGTLIDPFHGKEDIKSKAIRILHAKSFVDDPTRILRAIRFEQRFHFAIEQRTLELLRAALERNAPEHVKLPRYFDEFKKILREDQFAKPLGRLGELRGFDFIDPQLKLDKKILIKMEAHMRRLRRLSFPDFQVQWWLLVLLAVMRSEKNPRRLDFTRRAQLSQHEARVVMEDLEFDEIGKYISAGKITRSQIYRRLKPFSAEILLFWSTVTTKPTVQKRIMTYLCEDRNKALKMNGHDLENLGVFEGKEVGEILSDVLNQKIDRKLKSKNDELAFAKKLLRL